MSRMPTHLPPPSYHGWFFRYPNTDLIHQHRPVYYASGITKTHFRTLQLAHKNRIISSRKSLDEEKLAASAEKSRILQKTSASNQNQNQLFDSALRLARCGLTTEASPIFLTLHQQQAKAGSLSPFDYSRYIAALSAPAVFSHLHNGEANFDKSVTYKMMGDFGGNSRAQEAVSAFEMAMSNMSLSNSNSNSNMNTNPAKVLLYNSLMQTLLSCGYDNVRRVCNDVYDSLGVAKVNPTAATYKHVMLALSLLANPDEANHIMTFLRAKCGDELDTDMFNNLMLGYREARTFDRVDQLWAELVDRRVPSPNVESAEEMIRSIVELSNTPLSDPALQLKQQLNVVERKRIPLVLHQMEQLGVMRCQLCPPVLHEVESALRQFSIYRSRFYEWGRAVKHFDFVQFRRENGWIYDMKDISIPVMRSASLKPYGSDPTSGVAPFASETAPAHLTMKNSWERPPLAHLFNRIAVEEYNEDSRAGGDKYMENRYPTHRRDSAWRSKVPQTRFDSLYGISNPSMPQVGVRRHLAGTESSALGTDEHLSQRDNSIVRNSLSRARRTRQTVERARTHKNAAE